MKRQQRGFTLIELMVSLALFTVIYVVTYETLGTVLNGSEIVTSEQHRWRQLDMAMMHLGDDLGYVIDRKVRGLDGHPLLAVTGQPTDSRALSKPTLELTRSGVVTLEGRRETGLRRVGYRLQEEKLYREIWSVLDRGYDSAPVPVLLIDNLSVFEIRYLDRQGKWANQWPPIEAPGSTELPVAVDVKLTLTDGTELNRWYRVHG